jgi:hypothetical protein
MSLRGSASHRVEEYFGYRKEVCHPLKGLAFFRFFTPHMRAGLIFVRYATGYGTLLEVHHAVPLAA